MDKIWNGKGRRRIQLLKIGLATLFRSSGPAQQPFTSLHQDFAANPSLVIRDFAGRSGGVLDGVGVRPGTLLNAHYHQALRLHVTEYDVTIRNSILTADLASTKILSRHWCLDLYSSGVC